MCPFLNMSSYLLVQCTAYTVFINFHCSFHEQFPHDQLIDWEGPNVDVAKDDEFIPLMSEDTFKMLVGSKPGAVAPWLLFKLYFCTYIIRKFASPNIE